MERCDRGAVLSPLAFAVRGADLPSCRQGHKADVPGGTVADYGILDLLPHALNGMERLLLPYIHEPALFGMRRIDCLCFFFSRTISKKLSLKDPPGCTYWCICCLYCIAVLPGIHYGTAPRIQVF